MKKIFLYVFLSALFIASCKFSVEKPPLIPDPEPDQPVSSIVVSVNSSFNSLSRMIRDEIKNPLANGKTPEIDIKLLATESITEEELVRELVKPFTPGHYITIWKEGSRKVSKGVRCALSPWEWGTCYKDIIEVFTYPVQVWVEPAEAVYRYVSKPITNLIDKLYDVGAWINYDVNMKDFEIKPSGQDFEIVTIIKTDLVIEYKQPATPIPFGPTLKLKGILNCSIENKCTFKVNISINPDLTLKITLIDDGTEIDFTKICNSSLAVKGLNIYQYINPYYLASKVVLKKVLEKSINNAINKGISDAGEITVVKDAINETLAKLQLSFPVSKNTWFQPNPVSGFVSQPYINSTGLNINIGLNAKPQIILSQTQPKVNIQNVPISLSNEKPRVDIRMGGYATYKYIGDTLKNLLKNYLREMDYKLPITTGNVEVYPSNKKIVLGIEIKKNKKNERKLGTIYLWGQPEYDTAKEEFYFKDLDFTLESKNIILKLISEAAGNKILAYLNKVSRFRVDKELNKLRQELSNFSKETEVGTVYFNLKDVSVSGVSAIKDMLAVYVDLSGEAKFNFVFKPEMVTKALATVDTISIAMNEKPVALANIAVIENIMEFGPEIKLPIYNLGDTIWYQTTRDEVKFRLAELKDKRYVGDTIRVMNRFGNVTYSILTAADLKKN